MIFKKTTRKTQPDSLGHLVEMLWSASTVVSFNFRFSQGKKKKKYPEFYWSLLSK